MRLPGLPSVASRTVRRHRRALAALAASLSVLSLAAALRPTAPPSAQVVVAGRDLAAGHHLGPDDLGTAVVAQDLVPAGSPSDPASLLGRTIAAPVARGEPLPPTRLVGLTGWAAPSGTVAVPVRFADPGIAALVSAGQRIDVLAAAGGESLAPPGAVARRVAAGALVLAVTAGTGRGQPDGDSLLGSLHQDAPIVVLAVPPGTAPALVAANAAEQLWPTLAAEG